MVSTLEVNLLTDKSLEITQTNIKKSNRLFFLCTEEAIGIDWLSKHLHSHIIGELVRVPDNDVIITALAYYETSLPVDNPPKTMPPIRAEIIGDARKIICTCCKRKVQWRISKAAAMNVIKRYAPK
jgi:hypothetical protein